MKQQIIECPTCGRPVGEFKDKLSEKEYNISGMCQDCQDATFETSLLEDNDDEEENDESN